MTADTPSVTGDALCDCQGDTMLNPRPAPTNSNTRVMAEAAMAPAKIDAQLTAEEEDSTGGLATIEFSVMVIQIPQRQNSIRMRIIGRGMPNSQSRIPRPMIISPVVLM